MPLNTKLNVLKRQMVNAFANDGSKDLKLIQCKVDQ